VTRVAGATDAGAETLVSLTARARQELRSGEALVFDWVPLSFCCAVAGEVSLRLTTHREADNPRRFVPLVRDPAVPVYVHRHAYPHLAGRRIEINCRRILRIRHFTSNLPNDLGLRASMGLPIRCALPGDPG
jgi:hypothetical protein